MKTLISIVCAAMLSFSVSAETLLDLQHEWAKVNYELQGDPQEDAFEDLIDKAKIYVKNNEKSADAHIWLGIIQSSAAGAKGGLGALSLAKKARKSLEQALRLDPNALEGSALTSLGTLYHKVPGWPIGFGDDDKARELLAEAVSINPDGIDSNYFMASYLFDEREYAEARKYLQKAENAAPRPARPLADKGRRMDIAMLAEKLANKKH